MQTKFQQQPQENYLHRYLFLHYLPMIRAFFLTCAAGQHSRCKFNPHPLLKRGRTDTEGSERLCPWLWEGSKRLMET